VPTGGDRKPSFSCSSGKPLLSGFVGWTVDRHSQYQSIVFIARDLDGDELAQEGAEGLGILCSNLAPVLSTAENAESLHDRLADIRGDLVGTALLSAGPWPLSASWHV
jgi:hypothetical protein